MEDPFPGVDTLRMPRRLDDTCKASNQDCSAVYCHSESTAQRRCGERRSCCPFNVAANGVHESITCQTVKYGNLMPMGKFIMP